MTWGTFQILGQCFNICNKASVLKNRKFYAAGIQSGLVFKRTTFFCSFMQQLNAELGFASTVV